MSMDKGQCTELTIQRMPEGGYVVIRGVGYDRSGFEREPLFASGDIADALHFIRDQIVPVPAQCREGK